MKEDIVFYIGLPKTGTTFLKKEIFSKMEGVKLYGIEQFNFNTKLSQSKVNLVVDDSFCGVPLWDGCEDAYEIMYRVSRVFPNAKVIFVRRDKSDWLNSYYKEYIRNGGYLDFPNYHQDVMDSGFLEFEKLSKYLSILFDEILLLEYETLIENPDDFIKKICSFIGIAVPKYINNKRYVSLNIQQVRHYRWVNKYFVSKYNKNGLLPYYLNPIKFYEILNSKVGGI